MKKFLLGAVAFFALLMPFARLNPAFADEDRDWRGFLTAYYAVPGPTLVVYDQRLGSWQDVAAALFLARVTHTPVGVIVNLRLGGSTFVTIANRYHVSPQVFYIPDVDSGPPYGNAFGYWRKRGRGIAFSDMQLENRILLLSTSRAFGMPMRAEAVRIRAGVPFRTIVVEHEEREFAARRNGRGHAERESRGHGNGHGQGENRGHGNGHGHGNGNGHGHGHGGD